MKWILAILFFHTLAAGADPCPAPAYSLIVDGADKLAVIIGANQSHYGKYNRFTKTIPSFLRAHIGDGPDKISQVVLDRARANFLKDRRKETTNNLCYLAMDATRPFLMNEKEADNGAKIQVQNRGYLICEPLGIFKPLAVAHGGGVDLSKQNKDLNLKNSRHCATYFSNVVGSFMTMGGSYLTAEISQTYKGKVLQANGSYCDYSRPFLNFDGEPGTDTANARERDIGAHPVILLGDGSDRCDPSNPNADEDGYVYFAKSFHNYEGGRTEGCLGMPETTALAVLAVAKDHPMSVYVYPERKDIEAMKRPGPKPYWNSECLKEIQQSGGTPAYFAAGQSQALEAAIQVKAKQDEEAKAARPKRPSCRPQPSSKDSTGLTNTSNPDTAR